MEAVKIIRCTNCASPTSIKKEKNCHVCGFDLSSLIQKTEQGVSENMLIKFINNLLEKNYHLNPKGFDASDKLSGDLDLNSLDLVEIVMELEKEYDQTIPDAPVEDLKTLGDLYQLANKYCVSHA